MRLLNRLLFIVTVVFFVFTTKVNAQNMRALNHMLNRQFMDQQMGMMLRNGMLRGSYNGYNGNYTFLVDLLDSSKIQEVKSSIYLDTVNHKNYLLFEDKRYQKSDPNRFKKIYPSQTKSIVRQSNSILYSDDHNYHLGIPKDTCWMFKVIEGPISAYSFLSEGEGQYFSPSTIVGIKLNDGDIEKFTEENLKAMVGQDIDALENIFKKNYLKAIKKFNRNAEKAAKK